MEDNLKKLYERLLASEKARGDLAIHYGTQFADLTRAMINVQLNTYGQEMPTPQPEPKLELEPDEEEAPNPGPDLAEMLALGES